MKKYFSKDTFGVFEIRLSIERNNSSILCEQERFNNFSDACRYVFMMNNYEGKKQYPDNYFNYFVVYNPIKSLYEKY